MTQHEAPAATGQDDAVDAAARQIDDFRTTFQNIRQELGRVIVGHEEVIEQILIALFAGGHVLIEGVPGTGKTLIVRTLAHVLNLSFSRIQFTVDLMPSDITGTRILLDADGRRHLTFVRGPVFAHVLLADEINRATPKTQSALLEAMAELQVTASGSTYPLEPPFFVLATLNPIEMEGTYPLPEAQLDRFFFKVFLPYPDVPQMQRIISTTTTADLPQASPVFPPDEAASRIEGYKRLVREVLVAPHLEEYAAQIIRATVPPRSKLAPGSASAIRVDESVTRYISFGSSPRGGQALLLGAKVRALLAGRVNITAEDIESVAVPALNHRLVLNFAAQADGVDPREIVTKILHAARQRRK